MSLLKLINDAGEANVFCQHLIDSSPNISQLRYDASITFRTSKDKAQSVMNQILGMPSDYEALVIFIPKKKI